MANIDRIVNVQISLETAGLTQEDFETIMIIGPEFNNSSRVLSYVSASDALEDGMTETTPLYLALRSAFSQTPRPRVVKVGQMKTGETWTQAVNAVYGEDSAWYGLAITSRDTESIQAVAAWTETAEKLFGYSTAEAGAISATSTTDTPFLLKENNYFRTFGFYHAKADIEFPEVAIMARCFSILPGGETWANKRLGGITTDRLTETQFIAARNKNLNTFEAFRNLAITQIGKTAAGEWIDVIRFRDWLKENIQTEIFIFLINRDKLPYTDNGIAGIESKLGASLSLGQDRQGIAPTEYDEDGNEIPGWIITVPLAANIPVNDKINRILRDVRFGARLAGAIHAVDIIGKLGYEFS